MKLRQIIKKMLMHSPLRYSERMDALLRLTLLKSWLEDHQPHPYLDTREHLYAHVAKNIVGEDVPITFLEFGVYEGASLLAWTQLNTANRAILSD